MFVTGLEKGLVPISHAKTSEAMDEEQRLLYVALSRAERVLHLSWARERTVGGRTAKRNPSSWLARVDDAVHPGRAPADGSHGDARRSIADARDRVARASGGSTRVKTTADVAPADAPLYDALVDWRLRQSRAASAPAYVIFPNTTLAGIASARPPSMRRAARRSRRRPGEGRALRRRRARPGRRAPALGVGVDVGRRLTWACGGSTMAL